MIMCPSMKIFYGLLHVFSQKAMKNKKKDFRRNILICFYKFSLRVRYWNPGIGL